MNKQQILSKGLILLVIFSTLFSCTPEQGDDFFNDKVPLGQVWAEINGEPFRFDNAEGIRERDANSYSSQTRLISIYRSVSRGKFFGQMNIKITTVDIDKLKVPQTLTRNVQVTFAAKPNDLYVGKDGQMTIEITSLENDIIKGTLKGTVRSQDRPNSSFTIRNGRFHIKLTRF